MTTRPVSTDSFPLPHHPTTHNTQHAKDNMSAIAEIDPSGRSAGAGAASHAAGPVGAEPAWEDLDPADFKPKPPRFDNKTLFSDLQDLAPLSAELSEAFKNILLVLEGKPIPQSARTDGVTLTADQSKEVMDFIQALAYHCVGRAWDLEDEMPVEKVRDLVCAMFEKYISTYGHSNNNLTEPFRVDPKAPVQVQDLARRIAYKFQNCGTYGCVPPDLEEAKSFLPFDFSTWKPVKLRHALVMELEQYMHHERFVRDRPIHVYSHLLFFPKEGVEYHANSLGYWAFKCMRLYKTLRV